MAFSWPEYKSSLKDTEVEELIDLYFYRLLGYGFVKVVSWSPITPNQITYVGMIFGVLSALSFAGASLVPAALFLLLANVMDCADGQLARLKKNGTYLGGIIDGFFDYIVGASTLIGICICLMLENDPLPIALLILAAGFSRAFQNILVDQRRHFYAKSTSLESDAFILDEQSLRQHRRQQGGLLEKMILRSGLAYIAIQRFGIRLTRVTFNDFKIFNDYPDHRSFLLRSWSFLGSSTHITLAILAALLNRLAWYLWITLIAGNLYLLMLVLTESFFVHRFSKITVEAK
ncbi:CDP-alcohol phosphatidyltransferase family protein [bacterium]|nr:CDP-alcohol phosphatidyltransferase family protein [bacterium]